VATDETYGPFEAPEGDPRNWSQDDWYDFAPSWAYSGVVGSTPTSNYGASGLGLSVNGRVLSVNAGRAWVCGSGYQLAGDPKGFTVPVNTHGSWSRRDRLVLRRDRTNKTVTLVLLSGTPAATPSAPDPQLAYGDKWDLLLFSWLTPPNSGNQLSDVRDERCFLSPQGGRLSVWGRTGQDAVALWAPDGLNLLRRDSGLDIVRLGGQWRLAKPQPLGNNGTVFGVATSRLGWAGVADFGDQPELGTPIVLPADGITRTVQLTASSQVVHDGAIRIAIDVGGGLALRSQVARKSDPNYEGQVSRSNVYEHTGDQQAVCYIQVKSYDDSRRADFFSLSLMGQAY
jgi:hypothetical protein